MATTSDSSVSFDQTDTRSDEMNSTIEQWIDDLVAGVDDAQASEEFQEWLDVQSRFHDYSYRNTLLIKRQCPEASQRPLTRPIGGETGFSRHSLMALSLPERFGRGEPMERSERPAIRFRVRRVRSTGRPTTTLWIRHRRSRSPNRHR